MNSEDKLVFKIETEEYVFEEWIIDHTISIQSISQ